MNKYVIFDRFERSVWVKRFFLEELEHWGYTLIEDFNEEALAVLEINNKTYKNYFHQILQYRIHSFGIILYYFE